LALSIDDNDPDTLALAAIISAFFIRDYEGAIELADRSVALNPNSFHACNCRGYAHRLAGLLEEAVLSFERAMRVSPVDPYLVHSHIGIAYAFIELGRFGEAIVAGKKALRLTPTLGGVHPVSRPPSLISDGVSSRSITPSQYRRGWIGADN
jgi:adenylate cyclase